MNFLCVKSIYIFSMAGPQHSICCPGRHLCPSSCTPASTFRFIPGGHAGVLGSSLPAFCTPAHDSLFHPASISSFLCTPASTFRFIPGGHTGVLGSSLPAFCTPAHVSFFSTGFHFLLLLHAGFHLSLHPRRARWSSWLLSPRFLHASFFQPASISYFFCTPASFRFIPGGHAHCDLANVNR